MRENDLRTGEMIRTIRDRIYEQTRNLSPDELRPFIQREADKASPEAREPRFDRSAA